MAVTVIKPKKGLVHIDLREIWQYRDLFYTFGWRDVKVRYKQTAIGVLWAVIQPLVTMVIYTITFGRVAKMPSDGIPYPIFAFAGLLFWNLFSQSLTNSSNSLVQNENIVKKIYFPRLVVPTASVAVCIVDFACSFLVFIGMIIYFQIAPSFLGIVLLPVLALWSILSALGLGWLLAAVNAKYRDVRYALPFVIQLLVFVSPVIYPTSIFKEYKWILSLNPMTGVIEVARYTLLGAGSIDVQVIATSLAVTFALLFTGFVYFQNMEKQLADVL